ncbi:unnamed protein product [Ilex paraguariensis]|uniref:AP180 N-terminal homology (ANTH) domain-containing protein n=1 Tax=Ilex paraguariensis TaxID=185542 RepID=A0ABC8S4L7_9AQUA
MVNLVDKFFEMQRHDAVRALEIYRKAGDQALNLSLFRAMRANKGEQWIQERIKKYGPISKLNVFVTPTVLLHGQAANKFIYTCDSNILVNKQPASLRRLCGERNILELTGEDHRRMRAALVSFLKPEVLRQYVGKMDEEVRMHLQMHWHDKQQVKVCQLLPLVRKKIL